IALSRPTDLISSSRLGDDVEAQGIAVYNWDGRSLRLQSELVLGEDEVFETLGPFVLRTGEAGETVLMLPVTLKDKGSQVRSYTYSRGRLREKRKGPLTEADHWIHVLGSSRLGDSDRAYLVTALLPSEDDGDLVLYRMDLANTRITLGSAVSTHQEGSRLLESVLIADVDRDGNTELLAPGPGMSSISIYSLERNRIREKEIFSSSGKVSTNLCPGDYDGDGISDVMFGLDDGTVVILFGQ
ncbi:MAG: VCBS repeat-containing protein, partial [bacterium]